MKSAILLMEFAVLNAPQMQIVPRSINAKKICACLQVLFVRHPVYVQMADPVHPEQILAAKRLLFVPPLESVQMDGRAYPEQIHAVRYAAIIQLIFHEMRNVTMAQEMVLPGISVHHDVPLFHVAQMENAPVVQNAV